MLKKDFDILVSSNNDYAFKGFSQLIVGRKYGQNVTRGLNSDRTFLQNELIGFIEEANISKGPSKELLIPRCMSRPQLDSILSELKNQLL